MKEEYFKWLKSISPNRSDDDLNRMVKRAFDKIEEKNAMPYEIPDNYTPTIRMPGITFYRENISRFGKKTPQWIVKFDFLSDCSNRQKRG